MNRLLNDLDHVTSMTIFKVIIGMKLPRRRVTYKIDLVELLPWHKHTTICHIFMPFYI